MTARIYTVGNLKGGTGRSTTVTNIGAELAERGYRVLIVDTDPQGSATKCLGITPEVGYSLGELINTPPPHTAPDVSEVVYQSDDLPNVYVIPAEYQSLLSAETTMTGLRGAAVLHTKITKPLREDYDYIFFDTPPNLGVLTSATIYAADYAIPLVGPYAETYEGAISFQTAVQVNNDVAPTETQIPFWLRVNWADSAEGRRVAAQLTDEGATVLDAVLPNSRRASNTADEYRVPMVIAQPGYPFSQKVKAMVDAFVAAEGKQEA